jgi:hypothetical protein
VVVVEVVEGSLTVVEVVDAAVVVVWAWDPDPAEEPQAARATTEANSVTTTEARRLIGGRSVGGSTSAVPVTVVHLGVDRTAGNEGPESGDSREGGRPVKQVEVVPSTARCRCRGTTDPPLPSGSWN